MQVVSVKFISPTGQIYNYSTNVPLDYKIRIEFDQSVDPTTANFANIFLEEIRGDLIPTGPDVVGVWQSNLTEGGGFSTNPLPSRISGTFSVSGVYITFVPDKPLKASKSYRLLISSAVGKLQAYSGTATVVTGTGVIPTLSGAHSHTASHSLDVIIVETGASGSARFRWEVDSTAYAGSGLTAQTYEQELSNWDTVPSTGEPGILIKFSSGTYNMGDEWRFVLPPSAQMSDNYTLNFSTITEEALSLVPDGELPVIEPPVAGDRITGSYTSSATTFYVDSITPESYSINPDLDTIVIKFSADVLDSLVIEDDTVKVIGTALLSDSSITAENGSVIDTVTVAGDEITINLNTTKLHDNNVLKIVLDKSLKSTGLTPSEATLGTDQIFYIFTEMTPFYASVDMVKLEIGGLITGVPDFTLAQLIYYWSRYLDKVITVRPANWAWLAERFIVCAVINALATGNYIAYPMGQSKSLGDLKIAYNVSPSQLSPKDLVQQSSSCKELLLSYLLSGSTMVTGVKSDLHIDEPVVGRLWFNVGQDPAMPDTYFQSGSRRTRKA
jgi:hypothetical protein